MTAARPAAVAILVAGAAGGCWYRPLQSHGQCPALAGRGHDMGAISDERSALRPSEIRIAGDVSLEKPARSTAIATGQVGARYGGPHLAAHAGFSFARSNMAGTADEITAENLTAGIGYRTFLSALGGTYRRGLAIRADLGVDLADSTGMRENDAILAVHRPFDLLRVASGQHYQLMAEARYELIGCHAPFIHAEVGMRQHQNNALHTMTLPAAIMIGAHPDPRITVFGEYGLVVGRSPELTGPILAQHLFRVGFQLENRPGGDPGDYPQWRFGLDGAVVSGDYQTVQFRATLSAPLDWGVSP